MTNREIVNRRLANQHLTARKFKTAAEVVRALGAVQAQDYAPARWGLALRMGDTTDAEIANAYDAGAILRTHVLRPTWHFVLPEDIRWLLELTAPRVHAFNATMYRRLGVDDPVVRKSRAVLTRALRDGKQLTRNELAKVLQAGGVPSGDGMRLGYILHRAELDRVICSGARRGKQFTYALLDERAPNAKTLRRDEALRELMRRYFSTRGPATLRDFSWWSGLTLTEAKKGMHELESNFEQEEFKGQTYWFPDTAPHKQRAAPTAYLLPAYDEYFIGFRDRSAIGGRIGGQTAQEISRALYAHIVFINGEIVGGWRRVESKDTVQVQLDLIAPTSQKEKRAIAAAAKEFAKFLGKSLELTSAHFPGTRTVNLLT